MTKRPKQSFNSPYIEIGSNRNIVVRNNNVNGLSSNKKREFIDDTVTNLNEREERGNRSVNDSLRF